MRIRLWQKISKHILCYSLLMEEGKIAMDKCPKCGSKAIDSGKLMSAGGVGYKSDKQRVLFVKTNCKAYACFDCGYVESYVDLKYMSKFKK